MPRNGRCPSAIAFSTAANQVRWVVSQDHSGPGSAELCLQAVPQTRRIGHNEPGAIGWASGLGQRLRLPVDLHQPVGARPGGGKVGGLFQAVQGDVGDVDEQTAVFVKQPDAALQCFSGSGGNHNGVAVKRVRQALKNVEFANAHRDVCLAIIGQGRAEQLQTGVQQGGMQVVSSHFIGQRFRTGNLAQRLVAARPQPDNTLEGWAKARTALAQSGVILSRRQFGGAFCLHVGQGDGLGRTIS
jgi:hypothetical protein